MTNLSQSYSQVDLKGAIRDNAIDLWICRYFKVLPTDERFQRLTDNQKHILLMSFFESPLDELAHMLYHEKSYGSITDEDKKSFKDMGYTDEQISRIIENVATAKVAGGF